MTAGLTGNITRAHFHAGGPGENGPVIFTICDTGASPCQPGVYWLQGAWPGARDHVADIAAGRVYVNLHTAAYPAGEVRAQVREDVVCV